MKIKKLKLKKTEVLAKPSQEIRVKSKDMEIIDDNPLYNYDIDGNVF